MLRHLSISNYAIIDQLEIEFDPRLNIITGETGAGKSIILGAMNMILGKRADSTVLRDSKSKAVIEGIFEITHLDLKSTFDNLDIDYEPETIIRREIRPNGKSRAFVNDSPVNLNQLRTLASLLVDLHAQQDSAAVLDRKFYLSLLDRLAGQTEQAASFATDHRLYSELEQRLTEAKNRLHDQRSDKDYLEFQYNEFLELGLDESDGTELEEELNTLEHAGQIIEQLQAVTNLIEDGEVNVQVLLNEVSEHLERISGCNSALKGIHERMEEAVLEIGDIARTAGMIADNTDIDIQRLEELQERQNSINRLLHKHRAPDVPALIQIREDLQQRLEELRVSDEDISAMEDELTAMKRSLLKNASKISQVRLKVVPKLEKEITDTLHQVGMPHAQIELKHQLLDKDSMNRRGIDEFNLYFSANKGIAMQSLGQVASGGERSRLMLAIKSLLARHMQLSTMIFDEIDTGISGEVAAKVGEIFKQMSDKHQIISITHLPQIAAHAKRHIYVYKDDSADVTVARIRALKPNEKVLEIAKMLSGDKIGDAAMLTAKELIEGSLN